MKSDLKFSFVEDKSKIYFREPINVASRPIEYLSSAEIKIIEATCLQKCRRGFVKAYFPVVSSAYTFDELENIAYIFFRATLVRYNPKKVKDPRMKYIRPPGGITKECKTAKAQANQEAQIKKLTKWFEVMYFQFINSFLGEVRKNVLKNQGNNFDYSEEFIERALYSLEDFKDPLIKKEEEVESEKIIKLKTRVRELFVKSPKEQKKRTPLSLTPFGKFYKALARRTSPKILKSNYKKDYSSFLALADDLQFEIAELTNTVIWDNDLYWEEADV